MRTRLLKADRCLDFTRELTGEKARILPYTEGLKTQIRNISFKANEKFWRMSVS